MTTDNKAGSTPARSERVRATKPGFYGDQRIRKGQTFTLGAQGGFSATWMERCDPSVPDDTAAKQDGAGARREARDERANRVPRRSQSTGALPAAASASTPPKPGSDVLS
jgi:hypothetical protein